MNPYTDESFGAVQQRHWEEANQRLTAKMLQEFLYEAIIEANIVKEGDPQTLQVEASGAVYTFSARKRLFDSVHVYPESIVKKEQDVEVPVRADAFLLELQQMAPISSETAGHLLKEYYHTLTADCHLLDKQTTAAELAEMDYLRLEGEMGGHPWITYNKGRIGFSFQDYLSYAPEHKQNVRLFWIAVHKKAASFQTVHADGYHRLIEEELNESERKHFRDLINRAGREAEDYYYMPVHAWQWDNHIVTLYAEYIAKGWIIPLQYSEDTYLPQQSIRTFVNTEHKTKKHVKLPVSILNTLVYRGLPSERTMAAPEVTKWIQAVKDKDPFLRGTCRVGLLGETETIDVPHPTFHHLEGVPYQYTEMLGAVWRESIYTAVEEEEKPVTLAALLHEDANGKPLVLEYVERSGLSTEAWIKQLFDSVLPPLLHYMYKYGTVFSPHGQNTIVVLKNYEPHRLIMKDFVDDVNVSDQQLPELEDLPEDLKQVLRCEPPEGLVQFIFTGLFICHFRYLSDLLDRENLLAEHTFWKMTVETIEAYQKRFPELAGRFELFNLFQPAMVKLCLNRNRMLDYGYGDGEDRPHASEHGFVENALFTVHTLYT